MATLTEIKVQIKEEEDKAHRWYKRNRKKLPKVIQPQQGRNIITGEKKREVPVHKLDETIIGPTNDPHPTNHTRGRLQPWPAQGDAADQASSLRPTEDEALNHL